MKGVYYLILSTFILRAAFLALHYDSKEIDWFKFSDQQLTFQWWFWRLMLFLVEGAFIYCIRGIAYETDPVKKYHCYKMANILMWIQGWYILEYCLHYTSVWITWEQLGFNADGRSGLSSHILTMGIFAYFGKSDG